MAKKTQHTVSSNPAPSMSKHHEERERQYQAQDALRTLTRAEEIKKDKSLMRDVKQEAKKVIKTASSVLTPRKPRG